jgi:GC-rich sequence DNA-binding factor
MEMFTLGCGVGWGLVGAWEFWVRLGIVRWNPIEDTRTNLDSFAWHSVLYEPAEEDEEPEIHPDGDLVSWIAIVFRLCKIVRMARLTRTPRTAYGEWWILLDK